MRVRAAVWIVGLVAASAAISAVALGEAGGQTGPGSTWGAPTTPSAPDAGPPAVHSVHSTWGSAPVTPSAPDAGPAPPPAPHLSTWGNMPEPEATDAGAPPARRLLEWGNESGPPVVVTSKDGGAASSAGAAADDAGANDDGGSWAPSDVGFSVGLSTGYAIPFGEANGAPLSSVLLGAVPIGVEAGWFFSPRLYVGLYFVYGFGVGADQNNDTCSAVDQECSGTLIRLGLVANWHFKPGTSWWDPWIGAGLGYETILLNATSDVDGSTIDTGTLQGMNVSLSGGVDFKPLKYMGIGPYAEVATGPYIVDTCTSASLGADEICTPGGVTFHGWLSFGVRFRTNL